jgi:hypothetical protein
MRSRRGSGFLSRLREHGQAFFTNWSTYDAPFRTKLGLTVRNRWTAVVVMKGCCGHHGQPGC